MSLLQLTLLGGIVGLDSTSFPQAMISRPLVAATLTGAVMGRPLDGMVVGLLLELFSLAILPIGATRYPETGTAAVAATAGYTYTTPSADAFALLLVVLFALFWERLGGASVSRLRQLNGVLMVGSKRDLHERAAHSLEARHLVAILLDFLRGALVVLAGIIGAVALVSLLAPLWKLGPLPALGVLVVSGTLMLASSLMLFGGWRQQRAPLTLGVLCGCAVVVLQWLY